jgi:hypothetical protein
MTAGLIAPNANIAAAKPAVTSLFMGVILLPACPRWIGEATIFPYLIPRRADRPLCGMKGKRYDAPGEVLVCHDERKGAIR